LAISTNAAWQVAEHAKLNTGLGILDNIADDRDSAVTAAGLCLALVSLDGNFELVGGRHFDLPGWCFDKAILFHQTCHVNTLFVLALKYF
jgi:hypothetical protein